MGGAFLDIYLLPALLFYRRRSLSTAGKMLTIQAADGGCPED